MNNPLWALLLLIGRLWWAGVKTSLRFWQRLLGGLLGWAQTRTQGPGGPTSQAAPRRGRDSDQNKDIMDLPPEAITLVPPSEANEVSDGAGEPPAVAPTAPPAEWHPGAPPAPTEAPAPAPPAPPDPEPEPEPEPAPAPAPEPEPEPGAEPATAKPTRSRFVSRSFTHAAGQRDYKLYLPGGSSDSAHPLIVMLHGCKQDPDDFARGTQMNLQAEAQGCAVLYPAQTMAANRYACWNWFQRSNQLHGVGEPALLAGMVAHVVQAHQLDGQRVFVAGLSAGGAMANILAHTYPESFAAVGVHSGLPHAAAQDLITALAVMKRGRRPNQWPFLRPPPPPEPRHVPLIVFHGDQDRTVHPLNGDQVVAQALGYDPTDADAAGPHPPPIVEPGQWPEGHAYTRTRYGPSAGTPAIEYWQVHGAGHAWSGGDARGSFTDVAGPAASQEMLRFFLAQAPR